MKIHKTRIRNIYRYLTMMEEGETFRLGVKVSNDMLAILGIYGFDVTSEGQTVCLILYRRQHLTMPTAKL